MAGTFSRIVWKGDDALRVTDKALAKGCNVACERLFAIVVPFTPYLEGDLTRAYGIHQASPTSVLSEGAQLQNSSVYAEYQHEGGDETRTIRKHTHDPHPAAMTKFVEVPFRHAATELQGIIAQSVKGALA